MMIKNKNLKAAVRKVIASYKPGCNFDLLVARLAGIGGRMLGAADGLAAV